MRVGVVRGDMPGPVFLSNLEPVSQYNPSTEPRGQEVYVSRPTVAEVEGVLANSTYGAGATLNGSDITGSLPLTINGSNDDLKFRTSAAASFTTVLIPQAGYSTLAALAAAIDSLTRPYGVAGRVNAAGTGVALESLTYGVNSYLENDTVANGSVANTDLGLADGAVRTMPSAATFITALNPVGGSLDVSTTTINAVGSGTNANALSLIPSTRGTQEALADAIAPQLVETPTVLDSFLTGQISELLNSNFNPDPRRVPALSNGAAVSVVTDDGSTTFTLTLPTVSSATLGSPAAGDITIAGTGLGNSERLETVVKVSGDVNKILYQKVIEANGGSVSATSIVIPAVLIPGAATVTTFVQVQVRQHVSTKVAVS